jgi:hypothetical protein
MVVALIEVGEGKLLGGDKVAPSYTCATPIAWVFSSTFSFVQPI